MNAPFQLILFPGLGADHRLFEPQRAEFADCLTPGWIPARAEEALPDYAARLAETIRPRRPFLLGGASFGGMVAYEMARHLRPEAVVMIGSCRTRQGIRRLFQALEPVAKRVPAGVINVVKPISAPFLGILGGCNKRYKQLCVKMFMDTDAEFFKWAAAAILRWQPGSTDGVPVFQIHGEKDLVIPAERVRADQLVPGGGHFINLTHAAEVNAFIRKSFQSIK